MSEALPLPEVDTWDRYGARAASEEATIPTGQGVEDYLRRTIEELGKPSPAQSRRFRQGWRRSRVINASYALMGLRKVLPAAVVDEMADELQALAVKYKAIFRQRETEGK
jgi:hypothetical protein